MAKAGIIAHIFGTMASCIAPAYADELDASAEPSAEDFLVDPEKARANAPGSVLQLRDSGEVKTTWAQRQWIRTVIAAAIIESVAKTAWKNGVNVQHANGGPGSCFGRNKGCAVQAQRRHVSMRCPAAPSRPCIRWTP